MFQVHEWPLDFIIGVLDVLENYFGESDEAMFEGVERRCEFIFSILVFKKSELDEVA
jgi:hypothetical protein